MNKDCTISANRFTYIATSIYCTYSIMDAFLYPCMCISIMYICTSWETCRSQEHHTLLWPRSGDSISRTVGCDDPRVGVISFAYLTINPGLDLTWSGLWAVLREGAVCLDFVHMRAQYIDQSWATFLLHSGTSGWMSGLQPKGLSA